MNTKLPEEYYSIAKVENVSEEVVKEYRKCIQHEIYVEKKERRISAFTFGDLSEIEDLLPSDESPFSTFEIQNEMLDNALDLLKEANVIWYTAVMDYFFSNEISSFAELASKYGVTKSEASRRVTCGIEFLRKHMK